jgi:hypothetical protein
VRITVGTGRLHRPIRRERHRDFAVVISRTTVAYTSILYILDWVTIGLLAYQIRGAARSW